MCRYRRREDGLGDLFATAVPAPLLQAVLCRVRALAQPFGGADDRSAGKRRLDALLDLLLGRQPLPMGRGRRSQRRWVRVPAGRGGAVRDRRAGARAARGGVGDDR